LTFFVETLLTLFTLNIKYGDLILGSLEGEECRILKRSHIFNECDFYR